MSMRKPSEIQGSAWGLLTVLASTLISHLVRPYAELTDLIMIHLLGVVLIAMRCSRAVSLGTAVASILSFDFLFIPPALVFNSPDLKSGVTFVVMLIVAAVISTLNERVRREQAASRRSEATTLSLYRLAQDLNGAVRVDEVVTAGVEHIALALGARARVLLGASELSLGPDQRGWLSDQDLRAASRAWTERHAVREVGSGDSKIFQPLLGLRSPVGMLALAPDPERGTDDDDLRLIAAFAAQLASAIERISLGSAVQHAEVQIETERMRNALLSTVSHDLRTPLSTIIAAGTTLADDDAQIDGKTRTELTHTIVEAAERLDGLVTNLLSATRMESGQIVLTKSVEALDELVGAVLSRFAERLGGRLVNLDLPADLPLLAVDPMLIEQVLINLVENALRYTPEDTPLYLSARAGPGRVTVEVADEGAGIAESEREKVFDKFFRGSLARSNDGGAGLGLMICRAAVLAHGGQISARSRPGGGACIEFSLPIADSPPVLHEITEQYA